MQSSSSSHPAYHFSRILLPNENTFSGLELEWTRSSTNESLFINVLSREIPAFKGNRDKALVSIVIEEEVINFLAARLEGGQRLLLPSEPADQIISALKEKKTVEIKLQGYRRTIHPLNFPNLITSARTHR